MNLIFWKKKTIIELLAQHLILMTHDEKVEHLKAIIPKVCPGVSVHRNPVRKVAEVKPQFLSEEELKRAKAEYKRAVSA